MLSKFYDGVYFRGEILRNIIAVYVSSITQLMRIHTYVYLITIKCCKYFFYFLN